VDKIYLHVKGNTISMEEKTLIFIPYQDSDNFLSDGILTREFAMLYLFWKAGYKKVINVKKPRTILDKKKYTIRPEFYPSGTIESVVRDILNEAETVQYLPAIDLRQVLERRCWWKDGYKKTEKYLNLKNSISYTVYSDNPFAEHLIHYLSNNGCKIYFDVMDNFAIHPSLNEKERMDALEGYKKILSFADCVSANSHQTCDYMSKYTSKEILLIKNGVFENNEVQREVSLAEIKKIHDKKKHFKKCVGYIGKLGLRLDANLIAAVSNKCADTLFVFVGGYLNGQINKRLLDLFKTQNNILHIDAVPSAFVYPILDEFDILSIPHSVGKNENGGDPLKLYQYLTRKKPIITTPILGVDEFKNFIFISDDFQEWVNYINKPHKKDFSTMGTDFVWSKRIVPVFEQLDCKGIG